MLKVCAYVRPGACTVLHSLSLCRLWRLAAEMGSYCLLIPKVDLPKQMQEC